uniref:Uncharacterized protein n=1 Tax=Lepeophtheirus salmonis TaxID=72036 RepID=A0A0K2UIF3_LEPSM
MYALSMLWKSFSTALYKELCNEALNLLH